MRKTLASFAALVGFANSLRAAGLNDIALGVDGESGALTGELGQQAATQRQAAALADALKVLSTQQGDQLAGNAQRAASALAKLSSSARKTGATNTATAAAEAAALCRRLAVNPEEIEAKGRQNDKDVNASDVRAVKSVNAEGKEVTTYVNTGGREK